MFFLLAYPDSQSVNFQIRPIETETGSLTLVYPSTLRADVPLTITLYAREEVLPTAAYTSTLPGSPEPRVFITGPEQSNPSEVNWHIYQTTPISASHKVTITFASSLAPISFDVMLDTYRDQAFRFWIKVLAESPWTAVISALVALGGLTGSLFEKQLEHQREKERQREEEIKRETELIDRLKNLPPDQRLREYLNSKTLYGDRDWFKDIWIAVQFEGWEKLALRLALKATNAHEAEALIALVETFSPTCEGLDKVKACLSRLSADSQKPDTTLNARNILSLYREFSEPHDASEGNIVKLLKKLVSTPTDREDNQAPRPNQPSTPDQSVEGAQVPQPNQPSILDELVNDPAPEAKYLLRQIKADLPEPVRKKVEDYGYAWFPLSQGQASPQLSEFLKKRRFKRHPFKPTVVEQEADPLAILESPPDALAKLDASCASWIWGPPGCGRTALAFQFCLQRRQARPGSEQSFFTIYSRVQVPPGNLDAWWTSVCTGLGRGVLEFLAINPYGLLAYPQEQQALMTRVIRSLYPNSTLLEQELALIQASWNRDLKPPSSAIDLDRGAGLWLKQKLIDAQPLADFTAQTAQRWLPLLKPDGFNALYLLLETDRPLDPALATATETWGKTWELQGVYLKLLEKRPTAPAVSWPTLALQVDLKAILVKRLGASADSDSLQMLCDPGMADPDEALIRAANGSPRRLVELGQALFDVWEKSDERRLNQKHFQAAGILP